MSEEIRQRGDVHHRIQVENEGGDGAPRVVDRVVEVWTGWEWVDVHALLDHWEQEKPWTADDLCTVLLAHADSLDVRVNKHAGNETVLAQIARSTPAVLRALVAEVRKP